MKKKVVSRKTVKKASVTHRTKSKQPNWPGMVLGALLVVGLGWWVYKANMQSVDINMIADRGPVERVMEKWTFDSASDFGAKGVWRSPAAGQAASLKDGMVVWDNMRSSVQIAAPNLNLNFDEPIRGKYVIKVKADMVQTVLPNRLNAPTPPQGRFVKPSPSPAPSQFKIVVLLYSAPFAEDGIRRLLGTQEVIGNLSDDMKEYEFAFNNISSKRHVQLMRLFFVYPPDHSQNITAAYQIHRGLSVKVDEVSVIQKFDAVVVDKRSPGIRPFKDIQRVGQ